MSATHPNVPKTYTNADYQLIGKAIAKPTAMVACYANKFDAAAMWYRLESGDQDQVPPSVLLRKLSSIRNAAIRLLKNLGIENVDVAADGPGNLSIFDVLASVDGMSPNKVGAATGRIGRMVAVLEGISATYELERAAHLASKNVEQVGDLTVFKEHRGHAAVNNWIADLLVIYRNITGSEPKTSVGSPGRDNEGVASGPLVRFLQEAGAPVGIRYDEDAWRSHVRTIRKNNS